MPTSGPMYGGAETSAVRNELPAWYTQYGQSLTGAGLGLLNQNTTGYQGYSTNGYWNPTVAGMTVPEMQALNNVGTNMGGWQGLMGSGTSALSNGANAAGRAGTTFGSAEGLINGASPSFNTATGQVNSATPTFNTALGQIGAATPVLNKALGYVNSASPQFSTAAGQVNSASPMFNTAYGQIGSASNYFDATNGDYSNASSGLDNAGNVISSGRSYLDDAGANLGLGNGALSWSMGNLQPAQGNAWAGGTQLYNDESNQAALNAYMNPYTHGVTDEIARLGNQNLFDNVIPGVNTTFVGSGQFGSTRNADFMNRAIRDNQSTITGAQAQVLAAAAQNAISAYGAEKDRQLQSGQTLGALSQVGTGIGNAYDNLANTGVNMTNANTALGSALSNNAARYIDLGNARTNTGNAVVNQGLASKQVGDSIVNQGIANKQIGDSIVNQGSVANNIGNSFINQGVASRQVGDSIVNQGLANKQIGDSIVNQGSAMTNVGVGRTNLANAFANIGNIFGQNSTRASTNALNDINALLTVGGLQRSIEQNQLDKNYELWQDWRDHPLQSLGALSQVAPNAIAGMKPDTVSSTGYIPQEPDMYQNLQEIINAINGKAY